MCCIGHKDWSAIFDLVTSILDVLSTHCHASRIDEGIGVFARLLQMPCWRGRASGAAW